MIQATAISPSISPTSWHELADRVLAGHQVTDEEALAILQAPNAMFACVTQHHFVEVVLVNQVAKQTKCAVADRRRVLQGEPAQESEQVVKRISNHFVKE